MSSQRHIPMPALLINDPETRQTPFTYEPFESLYSICASLYFMSHASITNRHVNICGDKTYAGETVAVKDID